MVLGITMTTTGRRADRQTGRQQQHRHKQTEAETDRRADRKSDRRTDRRRRDDAPTWPVNVGGGGGWRRAGRSEPGDVHLGHLHQVERVGRGRDQVDDGLHDGGLHRAEGTRVEGL